MTALNMFQSLTEQEQALKSQREEQVERVKAAAPDKKALKELEQQVDKYRDGKLIAKGI